MDASDDGLGFCAVEPDDGSGSWCEYDRTTMVVETTRLRAPVIVIVRDRLSDRLTTRASKTFPKL